MFCTPSSGHVKNSCVQTSVEEVSLLPSMQQNRWHVLLFAVDGNLCFKVLCMVLQISYLDTVSLSIINFLRR
jgi:hypothetical protein